jgi:protoporphyrinogen oxidase
MPPRSPEQGFKVIYDPRAIHATDLHKGPPVRVTVIGGGLAGLTCALELSAEGVEVVILESGDRFGGELRTTREGGFVIEEGADTFGAGSAGPELARELGLESDLLPPNHLPSLVLLNGALKRADSGDAAALLGEHLAGPQQSGPLVSLAPGMQALADAAVRRLGDRVDLRSGNSAIALAHETDTWTISPEIGSAVTCDGVVLAIPPKLAAWLAHPVCPAAARGLSAMPARSVVVVSLAYPRESVSHPLDATGFAVPLGPDEAGIESCGFASSAFPGRAPDGSVLLRASIRPRRGELAQATDETWASEAADVLQPILGITTPPSSFWVTRWQERVPDFGEAYHTRVVQVQAELDQIGLAELAGAAYHGDGIDGAVRSGRAAAIRLLQKQ